jgi:DNA polymerase elongation subunit (family B)
VDSVTKPKALVLDIETAPMTAYLWNLKDQYVNKNQIKTDWYINAWGAKWFGAPAKEFKYQDLRNKKGEDKTILQGLWKLIDEADLLITQNGKDFDWPKIKARFMLNGLPPPSHFTHIDVYKELKEVGFTSHSLDYLTENLCKKYKKLSHPKFAGLKLWIECDKNNPEAWREMEIYNKHDVLSTEELLQVTLQWLPKVQYNLTHSVFICKKCGGKTFTSNGARGTKNSYIRKYCRACGELCKEKL